MKLTSCRWPVFLLIITASSVAQVLGTQSQLQEVKDAEDYNSKGTAHYSAGRYKEAAEAFKEAIRLKPVDAEAHNNLGLAYTKSGKPFDAINPLKEAIRLKPDWAEPYNNLGIALIRISKFEEAIKVLKEAVRLKSDWAQAHLNLGVAYIKLKDRQKALEEHEILKKLNPEMAKSLFDIIEEPSKVVSGGILNGKALSLPKPTYPPAAARQRITGTVAVQVTIDEEGKVIAAKAISGHPLLQADAVWAARQARFAPMKLEDEPVQVTGVITYNFLAH